VDEGHGRLADDLIGAAGCPEPESGGIHVGDCPSQSIKIMSEDSSTRRR
jgi:hypothetical protein